MKNVFLATICIALGLGLCAQPAIIPQPVQLQQGEGFF